MAEDNTHIVKFVNQTDQVVTFVNELSNGTYGNVCFTLQPGDSRGEEVPGLTFEKLRMVVGADTNGTWTSEYVTTDDLHHLEQVIIIKTSEGNFHLDQRERYVMFSVAS